jgi:hypothetical protein
MTAKKTKTFYKTNVFYGRGYRAAKRGMRKQIEVLKRRIKMLEERVS